MNKIPLKKAFITALWLGALIHSWGASADSLNGSLGTSSGATDSYRVTCSANINGATDNLKVTLIDLAPVAAPMVSVQVIKAIWAKNTTDAVDGDAKPSLAAIVKGGDGIYDVRVNKTAADAELYTLKYTCMNSVGKSTGTAIVAVQNQ